MENQFAREELLLGAQGITRLQGATVAVLGVGGVGSFVVEALARSGVGRLILVDNDVVSLTNLNRQLIALHSTLGRLKVEVARERVLDINPALEVVALPLFLTPDNLSQVALASCQYVVDAIDNVSAKIAVAVRCQELGVPLLSSMGTGNKLDPSRLELGDLADTTVCPLARVMRRELKRRGILHLRVLFSREEPLTPAHSQESALPGGHRVPGSTAFVPSVAGLLIAGEVVRALALAEA